MSSTLLEADARAASSSVEGAARPRRKLHPNLVDALCLSIPVLFTLWMLRSELINVPYLNDSAMHKQMVRWAVAMLEGGRNPLEGWYPYLQLGAAHFAHYQSLPHLLTAFAGTVIGAEQAFHLALYLLLALWPVSVYVTARLFCLGRPAAVAAAVISPLVASEPGLGYEWSSYVWRSPGVWSQLWGMVLIGPAIGLSWRAVRGRGSVAAAAACVAGTVALHFLTGYLALASLAIWVIVRPSEVVRRALRAVVVGAGAMIAAAWVLYPVLRDNAWINRTVADPRVDHDSFGARRVLGWLFSGGLFDSVRWPVVTLLVGVGVLLCIRRFRSDEGGRAILGLFGFSLLLYFGRPTLGPLLELVPGSDDLFLTRFISGVHLAGILLAGMAAAALISRARTFAFRLTPVRRRVAAGFAVYVLVVAATSVVGERGIYAGQNRRWIQQQLDAESVEGANMDHLVERAKSLGGGRIYAGMRLGWGDDYVVGFLPGSARLAARDADTVGLILRTGSLTSDVETVFDDSNPAHFELFNVRYLILPEERDPAVPAKLLERRGRHVLWQVETSGYLKVVDTVDPVSFDNSTVLAGNRDFLDSDLIGQGLHPTVRFAGQAAPAPTRGPDEKGEGLPGRVLDQFEEGILGRYGGSVTLEREGVVMLKASFDPGWTATVDGAERRVFMVAPTFVGVEVGPGEHDVRFEHRSSTNYPLLLAIGALTLGALLLLDRRKHGWWQTADAAAAGAAR